jgi:hypothetical protein
MAVTAKFYGNAIKNAFLGLMDLDNDVVRVSLHTSTYVPNQDTDEFYDDVTDEVANGNGYTTGGEVIANMAVTYDADTNTIKIDGDDVTWTSSTITARVAVIYVDTGTASTSPLIGYIDFGEDKSSNNGDFKIQWHADGIAKGVAS